VVSDVPVDDEAPVVTSRISRSAGAQFFGGAHRGRVCVRVFIGVSMRACCERLCCTVSISKKKCQNHLKRAMHGSKLGGVDSKNIHFKPRNWTIRI
jgi:hypothetical protein